MHDDFDDDSEKRVEDALDAEWAREMALEDGSLHGVDAYNDFMEEMSENLRIMALNPSTSECWCGDPDCEGE